MNRFVQSMGWGGLVQITARWFESQRLAMVMGILTMSYLAGDVAARFYLGGVIKAGVGWQGLFLIAAVTLGIVGVISLFTLKNRPATLGLPEPPPPPGNVYGEDRGNQRSSVLQILLPLLTSYTFWVVCLMNMGLTLIRETFSFWTPTYLKEVVHMDSGTAGIASLVFPLSGALSALTAGWLANRLGGRFGPVVAPSLISLVIVLGLLAMVPMAGMTWIALATIGAVAFFLMGPYTFCSGALAIKLGGQRGGATAAGIIDTMGYLCGVLAGSGVGRIAEAKGWEAAFAALAAIAGLTLCVSAVYWLRERRKI
jgi:OPA family glycerol-3-phosphate transporter-like MFS transporter